MKVFVVFDSCAEAYGIPFFMSSTGEAVRGFSSEAKRKDSKIAQHPDDFTLFEIGEYDQFTGEIQMYQAKKSLGVAIEYVKATPHHNVQQIGG